MHTCISSHGLKRSWRSCPRRVNAGNKNTPSTHHPQRRNVTTLMVGLKNSHAKISPQSGEPQRYSSGMHKTTKNKNKKKLAHWNMTWFVTCYDIPQYIVLHHAITYTWYYSAMHVTTLLAFHQGQSAGHGLGCLATFRPVSLAHWKTTQLVTCDNTPQSILPQSILL